MADVFFSYSRDDSQFVLDLANELRASGIDLWLDQIDIDPGQKWDRAIESALEGCKSLVVVLSRTSVESVNVMDEVSYALETGKKVVPVVMEECQIPFRLRRVQHVDFTKGHERALRRLKEALLPEDSGGADATPLVPVTPVEARDASTPAEAVDAPVRSVPPQQAAPREDNATPASTSSSERRSVAVPIAIAAVVVLGLVVLFALRPWQSTGGDSIGTARPETGAPVATENGDRPTRPEPRDEPTPGRATSTPAATAEWDLKSRPGYVVVDSEHKVAGFAKERLGEVQKRFKRAGVLWIPDYASLDGAELFWVYLGPFETAEEGAKAACRYLETFGGKPTDHYAILVSTKTKMRDTHTCRQIGERLRNVRGSRVD